LGTANLDDHLRDRALWIRRPIHVGRPVNEVEEDKAERKESS